MKNAVVINALGINEYAFKDFTEGESSFSMVLRKAESFPGVKDVFVLCTKEIGGIDPGNRYTLVIRKVPDMNVLFETVMEHAGEGKFDNIFYVFADTPLIDPAVTERMYSNHQKYFASYTFAEGFPYGLAPEILKTGILPPLIRLAEKESIPVSRDGIFDVVKKDINFFLSPSDIFFLI